MLLQSVASTRILLAAPPFSSAVFPKCQVDAARKKTKCALESRMSVVELVFLNQNKKVEPRPGTVDGQNNQTLGVGGPPAPLMSVFFMA